MDNKYGVVTRIMDNAGAKLRINSNSPVFTAVAGNPIVVIDVVDLDGDLFMRTGVEEVANLSDLVIEGDKNVAKALEETASLPLETIQKQFGDVEVLYNAGDFLVYKDLTGMVRFFGIYSNKYIDRESEIVTEAAHKEFISAVESGRAPYPTLQLWHIKAPIGDVDKLMWSEHGFAIASGVVRKEFAPFVERNH
jgi:hypothetical protein